MKSNEILKFDPSNNGILDEKAALPTKSKSKRAMKSKEILKYDNSSNNGVICVNQNGGTIGVIDVNIAKSTLSTALRANAILVYHSRWRSENKLVDPLIFVKHCNANIKTILQDYEDIFLLP
jgi:hypothetical protein